MPVGLSGFRKMRGKAEEKDGGAMINGLGLLVGEAWYLYLCVRPCSCALPALGPVHWWIARLAVPRRSPRPDLCSARGGN